MGKTISLKTEKLPIPTKGFFTEIIEKTKSIKLQWKNNLPNMTQAI